MSQTLTCCQSLPTLSCFKSWTSSDPTNPKTQRFCTFCDMTPPMLALVASIVGIAAALAWNTPWLCLPFAAGALASCYMIHWASMNRDNKTLHENVTNLHEVKEGLTKIEGALDVQVDDLTSVAERFQAILDAAVPIYTSFTKMKPLTESLQQTTQKLEQLPEEITKQQIATEDLKQIIKPVQDLAQAVTKSGLVGQMQSLGELTNQVQSLMTQVQSLITQKGQLNTEISELKAVKVVFTTISEKLGTQVGRLEGVLNVMGLEKLVQNTQLMKQISQAIAVES